MWCKQHKVLKKQRSLVFFQNWKPIIIRIHSKAKQATFLLYSLVFCYRKHMYHGICVVIICTCYLLICIKAAELVFALNVLGDFVGFFGKRFNFCELNPGRCWVHPTFPKKCKAFNSNKAGSRANTSTSHLRHNRAGIVTGNE